MQLCKNQGFLDECEFFLKEMKIGLRESASERIEIKISIFLGVLNLRKVEKCVFFLC